MSDDYKQAVLDDEPVGYWMLDDTAATTAADSSGNGIHGTYHGCTVGQDGGVRTETRASALFNGTTDYIELPAGATQLDILGDLTIEAWANHTVSPTSNGYVFACGEPDFLPSPYQAIIGGFSGSNRLELFQAEVSAGPDFVGTAQPPVPQNGWHHLIWMRRGPVGITYSFYPYMDGALLPLEPGGPGGLDGSLVAPQTSGSVVRYIGIRTDLSSLRAYAGRLQHVAVYDYALTEQQIRRHLARANGSDYSERRPFHRDYRGAGAESGALWGADYPATGRRRGG